MKKREEYIGKVHTLRFPNRGMVEVEGEESQVMVKNTLPGQLIKFQLTKNRDTKKEGRLIEVIKASELESEVPVCPHFTDCGGCSYQRLTMENQKELKYNQVKTLLRQVGMKEEVFGGCISNPSPWAYRNKMEFSFGDEEKGGELALGLHKRGSFYDIVKTSECKIVHTDIQLILQTTLAYFQEKKTTFFHKRTHEGYLRHLLIRRSEMNQEYLVCLVTTTQEKMGLQDWCTRLCDLPLQGKLAGILHMDNDSLGDVVKSDHTEILYGQDYLVDGMLDLEFKITPFSFFQTNTKGAERLYEMAREYIGDIKGKTVFDLYSGTGTIAQVLAPVAKKVIGVEIVEEAVEAARINAKHNGLMNCEFIAGDVLKVLETVEEKPDVIVLDPPREGVHPKALAHILEYQVSYFVYISCKPTSLARDFEAMTQAGYAPIRCECVDLFTWTRGIETIVLFVKD